MKIIFALIFFSFLLSANNVDLIRRLSEQQSFYKRQIQKLEEKKEAEPQIVFDEEIIDLEAEFSSKKTSNRRRLR